ncbi:MAG TPA: PTS sugar transporter subunit IIA [Candidatus Binatia bacterium]|nr:PTS sugar transporter subunit IIA [Candidatus Binatia bacterium]
MKIIDFVSVHTIIPALVSREKDAALEELAVGLAEKYDHLDPRKVLTVLQERERISSTAIGDGVAIPHGKLPGLDKIYGAFARSEPGVNFNSLDGEPTHLFFVLIAPENAAADHLKALARISRLLKDPAFRQRLMRGKNQQELFTLISDEDDKF